MSEIENLIKEWKEQINEKEDENMKNGDRIKNLKEMLGKQKDKVTE